VARTPTFRSEPVTLTIPWIPPTGNVWESAGRWGRARYKKVALTAVVVAVSRVRLGPIPTPCTIEIDIYKSKKGAKCGDPSAYYQPVDKCFLDALTKPRGNKKYGLGLLEDDSRKYIKAITRLDVHLRAPRAKTVLTFTPVEP